MSSGSLADRLTTGAPAEGLTMREARTLGWKITRITGGLGGPQSTAGWKARKLQPDGRVTSKILPTCSVALEYVRRMEEAGVRS
jgi:hypothetical protein